MANLSPYTFVQELDNDGNPLAGGKIYTYEAGTSTPKATYTDSAGATENTNPIILDSAGRASIWLGDGGYKFVLKDSDDVTIRTTDNIGGSSATAFAAEVHYLAANTQITSVYQNSAIVCSGTITLSLMESAEAGEGFYFVVANRGSGVVTIDPNGTETIDGAATKDLIAGGSAIVVNNGAGWFCFGDFNLHASSQAEAEAGTENTKYSTPLRVWQAISKRLLQTENSVRVNATTGEAQPADLWLNLQRLLGRGTGNVASIGLSGMSIAADVLSVQSLSTASGSAPSYSARAWVLIYLSGGTPLVAAGAGNVSSVTDSGVGDYVINFTTALPDANYSIGSTTMANSTRAGCVVLASRTSSACNVRTVDIDNTIYDTAGVTLSFHR